VWNFFDFQGNGFNIEDVIWYATFFIVVALPFFAMVYRKSIYSWYISRRYKKKMRQAEAIKEVVAPLLTETATILRKELEVATRQIQPDANGGKSLTDLHAKVDVVLGQQSLMMAADAAVAVDLRKERERLDDHLTYHIEHHPGASKIS